MSESLGEILNILYLGLVLTGATLMVWLMMLISNGQFINTEPNWMKETRRVALTVSALGLLWGAKYCFEKNWTPWPPDIVLLIGIDLYFGMAIASAYRHSRLHALPQQKQAVTHH